MLHKHTKKKLYKFLYVNIAEEDESEPTTRVLHQLTGQLQRMITFYKYVKSQLDTPPEYDIVTAGNALNAKNLSSILLTTEREVHRIIKLTKMLSNIEDANVLTETKVKFNVDEKAFFDFLSCFDFGASKSIGLRKDLKEERIYEICMYIFCIEKCKI